MIRTQLHTAMLASTVALTSTAYSQVTVVYHAGTSTFTQTYPAGLNQQISIVVGNQHDYVEIESSGDLGEITVSSDVQPPPNNIVWILVTKDDLLEAADPQPSHLAAESWAGLSDNRGNLRLRAGISENLTGSVSLSSTSSLVNLRVNGQIQASVTSGNSSDTSEMQAGSVASQGDITRTAGRIELVNVTNGDMLGDIKAQSGSIGIINVTSGNIGSSNNLVTIEASAASSGLHIKRIRTNANMWANIDCNTSTPSTIDGVIETFHVGNASNPSTAGDFHGTLNIGHFTSEITIYRDLYGVINHGDSMSAGSASFPFRILVGRTFKTGATVNILPNQGLHGFVMLSRLFSGTGQWESGATVSIDGIALTAPNYSTSFTSLGGGAAGLTPYRLHNSACTPANGATELVEGSSISSVRLRHYGPIQWNSSSGAPVVIERRDLCTTGDYSPVSATFTLDDDNPNATEPNCTLVINHQFEVGFEYRIRLNSPNTNLQCWGADNVPVQWDSDYIINIRTACFADVTQDGVINVQDLLAVINAWGTCSGCPADLVTHPCGDGLVNVQDLLAVINGWGMECATFEFGHAGSMESVQDCMDSCSLAYTPYTQDWNNCVNTCVNALCESGKIPCD